MKKSRFSEQQIAFILKQADDGTSVEEVCRKAGISQQTLGSSPRAGSIDGGARSMPV